MADVVHIGRCAGCGKTSRLEDSACASCRRVFGVRCGPIMARIRVDPVFASYCYDEIEIDSAKRLFVEWFGLPEGCKAV